jgi:hypothetical protein
MGRLGWKAIRESWLMGGPQWFWIFFQFIQNHLNLKKSKWVPYITPTILNFCMWLAWDIMNNFLNFGDIQFPTQSELKILDQIQHLNL